MSENFSGATLSDADAEARYGPRWRSVLEVVRQAERLTPAQIKRAAMRVEGDAGFAAAWYATRVAAEAAGRTAARQAGRDAARAAARAAARSAGWAAAWAAEPAKWCAESAACAAVVADLVGTSGLTAEHVAILGAPWRAIVGERRWERPSRSRLALGLRLPGVRGAHRGARKSSDAPPIRDGSRREGGERSHTIQVVQTPSGFAVTVERHIRASGDEEPAVEALIAQVHALTPESVKRLAADHGGARARVEELLEQRRSVTPTSAAHTASIAALQDARLPHRWMREALSSAAHAAAMDLPDDVARSLRAPWDALIAAVRPAYARPARRSQRALGLRPPGVRGAHTRGARITESDLGGNA